MPVYSGEPRIAPKATVLEINYSYFLPSRFRSDLRGIDDSAGVHLGVQFCLSNIEASNGVAYSVFFVRG